MKALLETINAQLPLESKLSDGQLNETFETWWPKLEAKFKEMPEKDSTEKAPEQRDQNSMVREILELVRSQNKPITRAVADDRHGFLDSDMRKAAFRQFLSNHLEPGVVLPKTLPRSRDVYRIA